MISLSAAVPAPSRIGVDPIPDQIVADIRGGVTIVADWRSHSARQRRGDRTIPVRPSAVSRSRQLEAQSESLRRVSANDERRRLRRACRFAACARARRFPLSTIARRRSRRCSPHTSWRANARWRCALAAGTTATRPSRVFSSSIKPSVVTIVSISVRNSRLDTSSPMACEGGGQLLLGERGVRADVRRHAMLVLLGQVAHPHVELRADLRSRRQRSASDRLSGRALHNFADQHAIGDEVIEIGTAGRPYRTHRLQCPAAGPPVRGSFSHPRRSPGRSRTGPTECDRQVGDTCTSFFPFRANCGQYFATGASKSSRPRCASMCAQTAIAALVQDIKTVMVSAVYGRSLTTSRPAQRSTTTSPLR